MCGADVRAPEQQRKLLSHGPWRAGARTAAGAPENGRRPVPLRQIRGLRPHPSGTGARSRGGPRPGLPVPRGRCARICLPGSLRGEKAPPLIGEGSRRSVLSNPPLRWLRRRDHEVSDSLLAGAETRGERPARSPLGRRRAIACPVRADARSPLGGPAGRGRSGASALGCTRRGRRWNRARKLTLARARAKPPAFGPPAARGGMAARLLPLRLRPAAGPFLGKRRWKHSGVTRERSYRGADLTWARARDSACWRVAARCGGSFGPPTPRLG